MAPAELASFIYQHALPEAVDIEMARRIILEELASRPAQHTVVESGELISLVRRRLATVPVVPPPGITRLKPDLAEVRAELAASEAIQTLHSTGVLVAYGIHLAHGAGLHERPITVETPLRSGPAEGVRIVQAAVSQAYGLATAFQAQHYRLADGDIYLSRLDTSHLPSRARRCLREAVDAFRHGLYLSATMNAGAASESLWMELGRTLIQKMPSLRKLSDEVQAPHPSIGRVVDLAWDALTSHFKAELDGVLPTKSDKDIFKSYADRMRDRRNYAMHSDDAALDEPLFSYNETGQLLLDAADYYDHLLHLIGAMASSTYGTS